MPTRATKPPPPASTASTSSLSSGRQDRSATLPRPQASTTPHSRSSEEMSEPPRRSQRSQPSKKDEAAKDEHELDEDAIEEDEEVTRCVCGQSEYPGPALSEAFDGVDAQAEDAGGLFISCDACSVWQHGGCVGIFEEAQVPDKYYCEECRPKLHDLHVDSRGQNYSLYQPVYSKSSRKPSISKHGDKAKHERELAALRASADPATGRRRATMRSKEHDEEEEQIRRAIEESKRETGTAGGNGSGRRNGKRARPDSEDQRLDSKRQRRTSEAANQKPILADEESEDDLASGNAGKGKKGRTEAVQSARQTEQREKEKERDRARAEAAGRRQERAGRRRIEDEASEDTPKPTASAKASPPPPSKLGISLSARTRGGSSPPNGKKTIPSATNGASSGDEPLTNGDSTHKVGSNGNGTTKNSPERGVPMRGKFGRGRYKGVVGNGLKHHHGPEDPSELSIATMKRRMDGMAAFIAKAQAELAGDRRLLQHGVGVLPPPPRSAVEDGGGDQKFEKMNALEMAGVVSREILEWQSRFASGT